MSKIIHKIFVLLSPRERNHVYWLFSAILCMAIIEVIGVASILPFMAVVTNPYVIQTNKWLNWLYVTLGFSSENKFFILLGILALGVLIFSNVFAIVVNRLLFRFAFMRGHSIAMRLLSKYLHRPYVFFLNRNTAELGNNILVEAGTVVSGVLIPGMQLFAKAAVTLLIFCLLMIVDLSLTLTMAVVLGSAYAIIYAVVRKNISRIGNLSVEGKKLRSKSANEALSGIKEIKIFGKENTFLERFSIHSKSLAKYQASNQVIPLIPRYALETILFGGILLIVIYFLTIKNGIGQAIPLVALYAFAGYRLMPALQQIFSGITNIRYNLAALDALYHDLTEGDYFEKEGGDDVKPLPFQRELQLRNISFTYPGMQERVIEKINLAISPKTTVGFVGSTGSGKTTAIDVITGLLMPSSGEIVVDDTVIDLSNLRQWQKNIGYVPQNIYLCDDTVARNIAFGVPDGDIDMKAVQEVARIAHLHDFIQNELPNSYDTIVGERGVRLSGGQRQRIGIARALYHDPDILILDEATNALDGITEDLVMQAIQSLSHKKAIIIIAHRLTTVRDCDVIYVMDEGRIIAQGTFEYLIESCFKFRTMAKVTN